MYPIGKRQYKRQKRRHHFSQFEGELSVNVKNSGAELWFYKKKSYTNSHFIAKLYTG